MQPRGYRLLNRIPRLPETIADHVIERFGRLPKIMRASISDLVSVEGVGEARARAIKDGSRASPRAHPRPLLLNDSSAIGTLPPPWATCAKDVSST